MEILAIGDAVNRSLTGFRPKYYLTRLLKCFVNFLIEKTGYSVLDRFHKFVKFIKSAVTAFLRNQCTIDNLYLIQHNQNGWNTDASERSQQKDHLIYETMAAYLKLGNFSF